jgi:ABC-type Zn2+ transport system substrate-binding protein/surface adhesin
MDVSTAEVTYGFPEHRYTTSASGKFTLVVPVPPGTKRIDAVFSGTSAGGSDTIQVYVTKVAA